MRVANAVASNRVMGPTPLFPAIRFDQNVSTSLPSGVIAPSPVMTIFESSSPFTLDPGWCVRTRRRAGAGRRTGDSGPPGASSLLRVLLQVVQRITHGLELVRVFVVDVEAELLLERHHEFHLVERIGAQVLDEL